MTVHVYTYMNIYTHINAHIDMHVCTYRELCADIYGSIFFSFGSNNEKLSWSLAVEAGRGEGGGVAFAIFDSALFECLTLCGPSLKTSSGAILAVGLRVIPRFLLYAEPHEIKPATTT